jgi:hypothetical protein
MASFVAQPIIFSQSIPNIATIVNTNFSNVQDILNQVQSYLNTDSKQITNIQKVSIINGINNSPNPGFTGLYTNCSIQVDGDIVGGGNITGKTLTLSQGLGATINLGDLNVYSPASTADLRGSLKVGKSVAYSSYSSVFQAWKKTSYTSGGNNFTGILNQPNNIIGWVSLAGYAGIIIDFTGYDSVNTSLNVNRIKFLTTGAVLGQTVQIIFLLVDDQQYSFQIEPDNLAVTTEWGMTNGVQITKCYAAMTVVYTGTNWVIVNDNNSLSNGITIS